MQLWKGFGLAAKAAHKNQPVGVDACEIWCDMFVAQLLVAPTLPNAEHTYSTCGVAILIS